MKPIAETTLGEISMRGYWAAIGAFSVSKPDHGWSAALGAAAGLFLAVWLTHALWMGVDAGIRKWATR